MLIKRKVSVKVVVTETFKRELISRLRQALDNVEASIRQLERQGQGYLSELEGKDPAQANAFGRKLERQKLRQQEVRNGLLNELEAAEKLDLETEYHQGALEGLAEVRIGDDLSAKVGEAEIIIKDGRIIEIRQE